MQKPKSLFCVLTAFQIVGKNTLPLRFSKPAQFEQRIAHLKSFCSFRNFRKKSEVCVPVIFSHT